MWLECCNLVISKSIGFLKQWNWYRMFFDQSPNILDFSLDFLWKKKKDCKEQKLHSKERSPTGSTKFQLKAIAIRKKGKTERGAILYLRVWSTANAQPLETTTDYRHRQRLWTGNGKCFWSCVSTIDHSAPVENDILNLTWVLRALTDRWTLPNVLSPMLRGQ